MHVCNSHLAGRGEFVNTADTSDRADVPDIPDIPRIPDMPDVPERPEAPANALPLCDDVAKKVDTMLAALCDVQAQCQALGMPSPGEWDAVQCDNAYRSGYHAFERGDYAQAIDYFAPLLCACPQHADYAMALALSAHRRGETKAALPLFMAAALMDDTAPGPMYRVGECLIELGHLDEAGRAMRETLQRCAGQPEYAAVMDAARRSMSLAGLPD